MALSSGHSVVLNVLYYSLVCHSIQRVVCNRLSKSDRMQEQFSETERILGGIFLLYCVVRNSFVLEFMLLLIQ